MTDAGPEPDKFEADAGPEVRPEPVWARPTSPDTWGHPGGSAASADGSANPALQAQQPAQSPSDRVPVDGGAGQPFYRDAGPQEASGADAGHGAGENADDPAPPPNQYQPPQYAPPPGFSFPRPPDGTPAGARPDFYYSQPQASEPDGSAAPPQGSPAGMDLPLPGQFGPANQFSPAGPPDQSGQPNVAEVGQSGSPVPWFPDAGAPTQPLGGTGWSQQPYPAFATAGRKKGRGALIALLVGACLLVSVLGGVAGSALRDGTTDQYGRNPTISLPKPEPVDANRPASAVTRVAAAVLPSVVSINVQAGDEAGTGSGFVIDSGGGYILTNNHVVTAGGGAAATSIEVVFQDGTEVPGKVVGRDRSYDLAVVKVSAKGLRQLELGNSDSVRVGDSVVAIGAPLGLQGTVTTGIVSALNRPVTAGEGDQPAFINAIQTDAAINPGNSGGPLVDVTGRVIAVNSAIARSPGSVGTTAGNIGLGFAIPSNQARRTAEQLIRTGKASHPIIGVSLDSRYAGRGVKVSAQKTENNKPPVTENGPADKAGIRAGDIILKIDGRPVTEPDELIVAIRAQTPGDTITLTVLRGKNESQVRVKLSEAND